MRLVLCASTKQSFVTYVTHNRCAVHSCIFLDCHLDRQVKIAAINTCFPLYKASRMNGICQISFHLVCVVCAHSNAIFRTDFHLVFLHSPLFVPVFAKALFALRFLPALDGGLSDLARRWILLAHVPRGSCNPSVVASDWGHSCL